MRLFRECRAELSTVLGLGGILRAKDVVEELVDIRLAYTRLAEPSEETLGVVQVFFGREMIRVTPQAVTGVRVKALEDG